MEMGWEEGKLGCLTGRMAARVRKDFCDNTDDLQRDQVRYPKEWTFQWLLLE